MGINELNQLVNMAVRLRGNPTNRFGNTSASMGNTLITNSGNTHILGSSTGQSFNQPLFRQPNYFPPVPRTPPTGRQILYTILSQVFQAILRGVLYG